MSEMALRNSRSVVMLTADRQIDRRILLSADSLKCAGWKVTIIAMPLDTKAIDDPRVVRIGGDTKFSHRENMLLDVYRWVRGCLPMNGVLMRRMKGLAWRYLVDQESFFTRLFFSTASRYSPDVFVANDLPMLPVAKRLADMCGAKLVYDSHELYCEQEFSAHEKRRWAEIEAKYIGDCDTVITVNQSIASELERRYGINDVRVIYNAERPFETPVISRHFHEKFLLAADKKVLLLQGGISAGRNLEVLVNAMRFVKNPFVVLVILGDGLLLKRLQADAQLNQLSDRVYFHPAAPQKDLLSLTVAADAGVIPYQATCLNNYFCTPNKLFEFIAAGIPILASDLPEIRNMVQGRNIGLVGDMSTPENFARLIDNFFGDGQRLASWRSNVSAAREHVCWQEEEKKLIEIYGALG